jgi:hypothetical protein
MNKSGYFIAGVLLGGMFFGGMVDSKVTNPKIYRESIKSETSDNPKNVSFQTFTSSNDKHLEMRVLEWIGNMNAFAMVNDAFRLGDINTASNLSALNLKMSIGYGNVICKAADIGRGSIYSSETADIAKIRVLVNMVPFKGYFDTNSPDRE